MPDASERAAVLALLVRTQLAWHWAGALIEEAGGAKRLLAGDLGSVAWFNRRDAEALAGAVEPDEVSRCAELAGELAARGVGLVTVLDDDYPAALHAAYDRPPFLFVRGALAAVGDRAVAIAGTARAPLGEVDRARALATALAREGVAVVACPSSPPGLAALEAALDGGGRAAAVLDVGIDHPESGGAAGDRHPASGAASGTRRARPASGAAGARDPRPAPGPAAHPPTVLDRVAERGAVVSPCWPDAPPDPASDLHAATLSGLALGLVVLDGEEGSPPQRQAHRCLDQARRLFLPRPLVLRESWAKHYADHPGATVVDAVGDILEVVAAMVQLRAQLSAMT
jgi:DNA processing protein